MKVALCFSSTHFSKEDAVIVDQTFWGLDYIIEWDYPILPVKGDYFHDDFGSQFPEWVNKYGLAWSVDSICWRVYEHKPIAVIELIGE